MLRQVSSTYFPPSDATSRAFRISGAVLLISAMVVAGALVAAMVRWNMFSVIPISMLPVFILWFMGMHRLLWGGIAAATRGLGAARAALTGGVGFLGLLACSGLIGFLAALIHKAA